MQYRGTVEVFNNRKFFNRLQYKKMFDPKFLLMYFLIEYCYLPCNIVVSLFMLLAALIYLKAKVHNVATISAFALFFVACIHLWTVNWLYSPFLILPSGDVEINPGFRHNSGESFSISYWNLNSVSAYNYTKLSSLKTFIAVHKFDIICLSETYLDSSVAPDDDNLEISGCSLFRSDHPSNNKRGGVCAYCKNFLPLRVLDIQYLHECINFELKIGDKLCYFVAFYRSPSQTQDEFEKFSDNLKLNLGTLSQKNPFLVVAIGDFNAKSKSWYISDSTTSQGNVLENITSQFGLQQTIKEPTHILDHSSSCIDLVFTAKFNN